MTSSRRLRAFNPAEPQSSALDPAGNPIVANLYPEDHCDPEGPRRIPPVQRGPERVYDMPVGDAGAGDPAFRRIQIFTRLDDPTTFVVSDNPATRALAIASYKSSDRRDRLLHISFFSTGVINEVTAMNARGPLSEGEIIGDGGFVGIEDSVIPATTTSTAAWIPRISSVQGRVQIHDASGTRWIDVDVLGSRSISVVAWSATVFALVPVTGYEVVSNLRTDTDQNPQFSGLIEDSLFGARIAPLYSNVVANKSSRTIMVNLTGTADSECRIPIPPGARKVTVINSSTTATDLDYDVTFDIGAPVSGARGTTGLIFLDPVNFRTDAIDIPNSTSILIDAQGTATPATYSFVFEITA